MRQDLRITHLKRKLRTAFNRVVVGVVLTCAVGVLSGCQKDQEEKKVPSNADAVSALVDNSEKKDKKVCALNSDLKSMEKKLPQLEKNFQVLSKLPLTGKVLYNRLKLKENGISSCLETYDTSERSAYYQDKKITILGKFATKVYSHEAFHASQDILVNGESYSELTVRDSFVAGLLEEATAYAYELIVEQEAKNNNIEIHKGRVEYPFSEYVFSSYYESLIDQYKNENRMTRERKALEGAGQAVVEDLMRHGNLKWSKFYIDRVDRNINLSGHFFIDAETRKNERGYLKKRRRIYLKLGQVSPYINLIPPAYIGLGAEHHIKQSFDRTGITARAAVKETKFYM